jgi:hypothetical protein
MDTFKTKYDRRVKATGREDFYRFTAEKLTVPEDVKKRYKSSGAALFAYLRSELNAIARSYPGIVISSVYFGQYGVSGIVAYSAVINYARGLGLLTVCDENVLVTADNAECVRLAYLAEPDGTDRSETGGIPLEEHGFNADAVSVAPGSEKNGLERLAKAAEESGRDLMLPDGAGRLKGILSGVSA